MLSSCLLSDLSQKEGRLAGLDEDAMAMGGSRYQTEDRLCQVCHSSEDMEGEHFLFSCPAYSDVRQNYASLFQQAFSVSDFFPKSEPNARGGLLRQFVPRKKSIVSTWHIVYCLFCYVLYSVCLPPDGSPVLLWLEC